MHALIFFAKKNGLINVVVVVVVVVVVAVWKMFEIFIPEIAENAPNFKNLAAHLYSTCARLLFDYKELGLNADHTDLCGNIQLSEEIINHKAQPQGNSPLSTGFYYQQDCLKEC